MQKPWSSGPKKVINQIFQMRYCTSFPVDKEAANLPEVKVGG